MTQEDKIKAIEDNIEILLNSIESEYYPSEKAAKRSVLLELKKFIKSVSEESASEDERIRKNCIHFLELQKQHHAATFEIEECISWLGKLKYIVDAEIYKKYNTNQLCVASEPFENDIFKFGDKVKIIILK